MLDLRVNLLSAFGFLRSLGVGFLSEPAPVGWLLTLNFIPFIGKLAHNATAHVLCREAGAGSRKDQPRIQHLPSLEGGFA